MKVKPTLMLNMHCQEGRAMVQVGLDNLSDPERRWLLRLLQKHEKNNSVGFGVVTEGNVQIISFTLGTQSEQAVA
jgi:hypothetical protein